MNPFSAIVLPFAPLATLAAAVLVCASSASAQGSDNCSTAQAISGTGQYAFDTSAATTGSEGQIVACSSSGIGVDVDVWFRWTAPASGTVLFSTCGQTSVDTKIAVYPGGACPLVVNPTACSDDNCFVQSQTFFSASSGSSYLIQVGSAPFNPGGTGTFSLTFVNPVMNDDCALPAVISGTGTFVFYNGGATTGVAGQNNPGCVNVRNDVWCRWTAPATGTATLSLCGQTADDSAIAVYAGGSCPSAFSIACDDDGCNLQSITSFQVTQGSQYMLQIGSASGFGGAIGTFTIDVVAIPANDNCATPLVLGTTGGSAYNTANATTGSAGQSNPCGGIDNDLWFAWTAPASAFATVETCGQTGDDTSIAVYPAGGCPAGSTTRCDNDGCGSQSTVSFAVGAGSTWLIQIGNAPGAPGGPGSFTVTLNAPPITPYCFGDGSGSACPCGNNGLAGRGCANSVNANGALLDATGTASVGADTIVLHGSGMPNAPALYLQGSAVDNGGAGTTLFDGIRCVAGTIVRLATKTNVGGASQYPESGNASVSVRGGVPAVGGSRFYQVWYRNAAAAFCPPATANWTNGIEVLWVP